MNMGLVGLIIVLLVIAGAIITKRCTECLLLGSVIGAVFLYGKDFMVEWVTVLQNVVADNAWLWLVCGLFGSLIAVLTASKGTFGFSKIIGRVCNTQRKSLFATYIMGILIFIDDYLNVLSIGTCMKSLFDKRKMPREALAFLLDSTGAPVCVLIPFSTWSVFYSELFMEQEAVSANYSSGIKAYISAIPFCFYPICALLVVALFCAGVFPKLGYMKSAYERVENSGMTYSERSKKFNHEEATYEEDGNIWNFLVPMTLMVVVCFITNEILVGVIAGLVVCLIMYVPTKIMNLETFMNLTVSGQVSQQEVTVTLVPGYTLVCNPFPADLPLNSETIDWVTAGATEGRGAAQGDRIQVWDSSTQDYVTYFMSSFVHKWATGAAPRTATTDVIPAGAGFWYQNRSNSDITIKLKSPLSATEN